MATVPEVINARVAQARYRFYKNHRNVASNMANESIIESWADEHMKSLELFTTWEDAYEAVKDQLSENKNNAVVERPRAEAPVPTPEPVLEGQELLRKLKAEMYSENPLVAFESEDQLKRIATGPQKDGQSDKDYFALLYAPASLRRMSEAKLQLVRKKYGASLVSFTINRSE